MTSTQKRKVELIRRDAWQACEMLTTDKVQYEIKKFEVEENEYFVSVFAEIGIVDDESNPLLQYCGRSHVHIFVGKRGGMKCPVGKIYKNGNYHSYYIKYTRFFATAHKQK